MKLWDVDNYMKEFNGRRCKQGFSYCSGTNSEWLTVEQIRRDISEHIAPGFVVNEPEPDVPEITPDRIRADLEEILSGH